MEFRIKRLHSSQEPSRRYHLFDDNDILQLVGDFGTPWLKDNNVHFTRSNGVALATMNLFSEKSRGRDGRSSASYALLMDHAVYAIFNQPDHIDDGELPFHVTVEADDEKYLALAQPTGKALLRLYDYVPLHLVLDESNAKELPYPVGQIRLGKGEYQFVTELTTNKFKHPALIMLALVFLMERDE